MGPKLLKHITAELNETLTGGVVSKIHQPDDRNIILKVFLRGREEKLLISAHPKFPRMHLTGENLPNPQAPLRFCAFLRSRITNARIEGFRQLEGEKIVRLEMKKGFDGTAESFTLVCELTGKSSNIILIDDKEEILDALRYFEPETIRPVMPGLPLTPLPKHEGAETEEPIEKEEGITWNYAADRHYSFLLKEDTALSRRSRLKRAINEAEKKVKRKLDNLMGDREKAEKEREYGKFGELIIYNLHGIKRGMTEYSAIDYTKVPPEAVRVALDVKLGPKENAEKYFKRARKAKVALNLLKERIPGVEAEIEYTGTLKYELEASAGKEDLDALEDELIKGGYIKAMPSATLVKEEKAEPIRRFTSSEGFEILCGKSGPGNDLIVKKYAKDEDIWFHASKMPGSHALIKVAGRGKELTKKTIEEAAAIAAWYSKAQNASKVEVIYTEARNVKKPKGAKPGMVTVKEYKSIIVRPMEMKKEDGE